MMIVSAVILSVHRDPLGIPRCVPRTITSTNGLDLEDKHFKTIGD